MMAGRMTLSTRLPVPMTVKASSWDTQQQQSYNRNAPRKTRTPKSPLSLSLTSSASSTSTSPRVDQVVQIDPDQLLRVDPPTQRLEGLVRKSTNMGYDTWLPNPPKVEKPRSIYNAANMAYIGDCIYELYARRHFLAPVLNIDEFNERVMAVVRCEAQDALLQKLVNDDFLTEKERDVLRWGKNVTTSKTRTKKRAGAAVYNRASSLETLIGYLYLTDAKRLEDIMLKLGFSVSNSNQAIIDNVNRELQNMKQKVELKKKTKEAATLVC